MDFNRWKKEKGVDMIVECDKVSMRKIWRRDLLANKEDLKVRQ